MNDFREHLINRRDQAIDAAMEAHGRMTDLLIENEDTKLADAMADIARHQPYARWWIAVTDEFEQRGLDPMAALTKIRTRARSRLIQQAVPTTPSLFRTAQELASIEAARRFFNDTAFFNIDALTTPGPAAPTVTTPPYGPGPAGPTAGPSAGSLPTGR